MVWRPNSHLETLFNLKKKKSHHKELKETPKSKVKIIDDKPQQKAQGTSKFHLALAMQVHFYAHSPTTLGRKKNLSAKQIFPVAREEQGEWELPNI